jgi:hypothetical protein
VCFEIKENVKWSPLSPFRPLHYPPAKASCLHAKNSRAVPMMGSNKTQIRNNNKDERVSWVLYSLLRKSTLSLSAELRKLPANISVFSLSFSAWFQLKKKIILTWEFSLWGRWLEENETAILMFWGEQENVFPVGTTLEINQVDRSNKVNSTL